MDPILGKLLADFASIAARNTASSISTRVSSIRAKKQDAQTANELCEIINDLVSDREQLLGISRGLEEQFTAQRISDDEIQHLVNTIIPAVKDIASNIGDESALLAIEQFTPLLSTDMLVVLQTVGFNYRAAIGEPLTELLRSFILSKTTSSAKERQELELETTKHQTELLRMINDPKAHARYKKLSTDKF